MTIDAKVFVHIDRPDIILHCPKDPPKRCTLQKASGETLPILREAFVKLWDGAH
jgi:hypothetical protein